MDLEMWHAMHDDCGPDGCGQCVVIDLDLDDNLIRAVEIIGEDLDVFVHKAILEGMRHEGFKL